MSFLPLRGGCVLLLSAVSALAAAQTDISCELPDHIVDATYQIVRHADDEGSAQANTQTLRVLRSQNRVLHIHPHTHTADMWERNARGDIHFTRFYDSQQRAIEFYEGAAAEPSSQRDWDQAFQLIPAAVLADNPEQTVTQAPDCATVETYTYTIAGDDYTLQWLPEQQLILRLTVDQGAQRMSWRLERVAEQADTLATEVTARAGYITIDYADLGDQESDPFFLSMKDGAHQH